MKESVTIRLAPSEEQIRRLLDLQRTFAALCNALTPVVQKTHCWNRVGLHHLTYRSLRDRFPQAGAQLVCNAIYSVSRAYRLVAQHFASSRDGASRAAEKMLPWLRFRDDAPVFFDWHTVSIKDGVLSLYTLEGRMKLPVNPSPEDLGLLSARKIREIVLTRQGGDEFRLTFVFSDSVSSEDLQVSDRQAPLSLPGYLSLGPARPCSAPTSGGGDKNDQEHFVSASGQVNYLGND